ncbi:MAG: dockerin type I repeat-containing protein, partial [Oscillospiraceae bacterium]|nr:dockerin type I repeat-containing protein [Oscillospiraceae bacterium]
GGAAHSDYPLTIGDCPETHRGSQAEFATVRVYDKALTAAELQSQNTDSPAYGATDSDVALWLDFSAKADPVIAQPIEEVVLGDVNCDESVTVADAVMLARVLAEDATVKVSEQGLANADMNENGGTDQEDLTKLLRKLAGYKD